MDIKDYLQPYFDSIHMPLPFLEKTGHIKLSLNNAISLQKINGGSILQGKE